MENIKEQIISDWDINSSELDNCEILFHYYGGSGYDGVAFTLFLKEGKLYECNGSHCSCHGLEGQWSPEETTYDALRLRKWNDVFYGESDCEQRIKQLEYIIFASILEKEVLE